MKNISSDQKQSLIRGTITSLTHSLTYNYVAVPSLQLLPLLFHSTKKTTTCTYQKTN